MIDMVDVSVRRGATHVLSRLDWTVMPGEHWVVMGPNGSGKTTLLQIAAARLFPTTGTVRLLGEELGAVDVAELRQSIGWASGVAGDTVPHTESVGDVVLTGAWAVSGRWREGYEARDEQRAHRLLRMWGLADLAGRMFGTLSEGERKRTLLARALMPDPELLLLDEPGAGLDLGGREGLMRALSLATRRPDTPSMVLVTHHVEEIPAGFTHALLLREGVTMACGPMQEVLTDTLVSQVFGVPVTIVERDGRWAAQARMAEGPEFAGPL